MMKQSIALLAVVAAIGLFTSESSASESSALAEGLVANAVIISYKADGTPITKENFLEINKPGMAVVDTANVDKRSLAQVVVNGSPGIGSSISNALSDQIKKQVEDGSINCHSSGSQGGCGLKISGSISIEIGGEHGFKPVQPTEHPEQSKTTSSPDTTTASATDAEDAKDSTEATAATGGESSTQAVISTIPVSTTTPALSTKHPGKTDALESTAEGAATTAKGTATTTEDTATTTDDTATTAKGTATTTADTATTTEDTATTTTGTVPDCIALDWVTLTCEKCSVTPSPLDMNRVLLEDKLPMEGETVWCVEEEGEESVCFSTMFDCQYYYGLASSAEPDAKKEA